MVALYVTQTDDWSEEDLRDSAHCQGKLRSAEWKRITYEMIERRFKNKEKKEQKTQLRKDKKKEEWQSKESRFSNDSDMRKECWWDYFRRSTQVIELSDWTSLNIHLF